MGTTYAKEYLQIILIGFPVLTALHLVTSIFRALGRTVAPVVMEGAVLVINTFANGLLVLGWFGGPRLGVQGAALATILSCIIPCIVAWIILFRDQRVSSKQITKEDEASARSSSVRDDIKEIFKVGVPASLIPILYGVVFLGLIRICSEIGTPAQSGLGAALRGVEWIGWAACIGFNVSASVAVGQCIGAGLGKRAKRLAWYATLYGAVVVEVIGVILALTAHLTLPLVTEDPQSRELGALYLYWMGPFMFLVGTEITLQGVLVGAGRTMTSMKIIGTMDLLRVPIAAAFVFGLAGAAQGIGFSMGIVDAPPLDHASMDTAFRGVTLAIVLSAAGKAIWCLRAVQKLDFDELARERRAQLGLNQNASNQTKTA